MKFFLYKRSHLRRIFIGNEHCNLKRIISIVAIFSIIAFVNVAADVKKYCREEERLNTTDEFDEYLLVDAEVNSTIVLECRFCEDKSKVQQPKIWYWQDRDQTMEPEEVELGMDNDPMFNRIRVNTNNSLIIRTFSEEDVGIYRCYGINETEEENQYNYRLELIIENESANSTERGNITDWEKYQETNLLPVTLEFANSTEPEFVAIRREGIVLEVVSEWGPWGPCEDCKKGRGNRTRRGFCRIKREIHEIPDEEPMEEMSNVTQFFKEFPMIPCRSRILEERFPSVSVATRHLSEFILVEKCKPCKKPKKVKKKHKFKYKKRYVLVEGAHLAIPCPESSMETDVVWRKDSLILEKGKGHSFRKKDPEPRVFVDHYYTLYLKDVSEAEKGNYTCYAGDQRMLQLKITIVPKSGLLTEVFVQHLGYLSIIFLLTLFCYCAGIIRACRKRRQFKIQTYEQLKQDDN